MLMKVFRIWKQYIKHISISMSIQLNEADVGEYVFHIRIE